MLLLLMIFKLKRHLNSHLIQKELLFHKDNTKILKLNIFQMVKLNLVVMKRQSEWWSKMVIHFKLFVVEWLIKEQFIQLLKKMDWFLVRLLLEKNVRKDFYWKMDQVVQVLYSKFLKFLNSQQSIQWKVKLLNQMQKT